MPAAPLSRPKEARAWALYDWGNSAFATTVMAGFFPLFFKQYWSAGADVSRSTWHLGLANSTSSVVVALIAPLLGALADQGRSKKKQLALFAALGCASTLGLCFVSKGDWMSAALLYALASLGFSGSLIFYDSLLVSVASPDESDRVSSLGYAYGYLGGALLFTLNALMAVKPTLLGLADASQGVKASFAMVALWWAVFTLPLLRRVPEPATGGVSGSLAQRAFGQLGATFKRVSQMKTLWMFLLAYWLYIDGVGTVIVMAVDYGLSIGLKSSTLITALLITNYVGFPAAIGGAKLANKIGTKRSILIGIGIYVVVTVLGFFMQTALHFYLLAILIGLVQGGVQALSRSFFGRLIPADEAGEFFGFYNMLGKFSSIVGPLLMGAVSLMTGSPRISILSIAILFFAGGGLLMLVEEPPVHDTAS